MNTILTHEQAAMQQQSDMTMPKKVLLLGSGALKIGEVEGSEGRGYLYCFNQPEHCHGANIGRRGRQNLFLARNALLCGEGD